MLLQLVLLKTLLVILQYMEYYESWFPQETSPVFSKDVKQVTISV